MKSKKEKIAVALSGGVDSSVSAWLLKEKGYEVHGFFMKLWSDPAQKANQDKSLADAQKVAKKLNIPFQIVAAKDIFKKNVVDYFISEYEKLRTPNPCVRCNKLIKFGWFLKATEKAGFGKMATGHYARIKKDKNNIFQLFSGKDKDKDQSYFLNQLSQKQLSKVIFPVGNLKKEEVRKIARAQKLPVSDKKESQEICFIADNDYRGFLKRNMTENVFRSGNIVNLENKIVGKHEGLANYTIGQRKGIVQTGKNTHRKPLFVAGFRKKTNELIVSEDYGIRKNKMAVKNLNWISENARKKTIKNSRLKCKIRYRHKAEFCRIQKTKNKSEMEVAFKSSQRAIAPGQSAVFYLGGEVLGGGIISK